MYCNNYNGFLHDYKYNKLLKLTEITTDQQTIINLSFSELKKVNNLRVGNTWYSVLNKRGKEKIGSTKGKIFYKHVRNSENFCYQTVS